jgi:hypothetical protein
MSPLLRLGFLIPPRPLPASGKEDLTNRLGRWWFINRLRFVMAELTLIAGIDPTYHLLDLLTDNPPVLLGF